MNNTNTNNTKQKLITFLDAVGRTIFAERVDEKTTDDWLYVKNPIVVHAQPHPQSGQMELQLFPIFFKEFLADKDEDTVWRYNRRNITESDDTVFDFKLTL